MPLSWRLANPFGILHDREQNAWHAGHVEDVLTLPGGDVIAGTQTGGVWLLRQNGESTCLTDDWDTPDITCLEKGPDSPYHVYAAAGSVLYENRASNLRGWSRIDPPSTGAVINSLAVLIGARRIMAACNNGLFWADIPTPGQPLTYTWRQATGIPNGVNLFSVSARSTPGGWSGFEQVGQQPAMLNRQSITAVSRTPIHRDVFWIRGDGAIQTAWSHLWSARYDPWGSTQITDAAVAGNGAPIVSVARLPGVLDVFWIGTNGGIYTTWWADNRAEGWSGHTFPITDPNLAGITGGLAAVARYPNQLDVFWVAPDGSIWSTWWSANAAEGWTRHAYRITEPGVAASNSPITAVSRFPEHLDVFWIGPDGSVRSTWWNARVAGGWTNHTFSVTGPNQALSSGGISVVANNPQHLDVFWIGPDGAVRTAWWDQNISGGWAGHTYSATPTGVAASNSNVVGLGRNPIHLDVFCIDSAGSAKTTWWNAYGGRDFAANTFDMGRPAALLQAGITAIAPHEDALTILALDTAGVLWTNTWVARQGNVIVGGWEGGIWNGSWQPDATGREQLVMTASTIQGRATSDMRCTSVTASRFTPGTFAIASKPRLTPTDEADGTVWGFLRSDDWGATWSVVSTSVNDTDPDPTLERRAGGQGYDWNNCIAVSPIHPNIVLVGWQYGPFYSSDRGQTWIQWGHRHRPSEHLHADVHSLRFDLKDSLGKTVLIASDGGVVVTSDLGISFLSTYNRRFPSLQCYTTDGRRQSGGTLGVSYDVDGLIAAGLQDNGNVWCVVRDPEPTPWEKIDGSDGGLASFTRERQMLRNRGLIGPVPIYRAEWDNEQQRIVERDIIPITRLRPGGSAGEEGLKSALAAIVNDPINVDIFGAKIYAIGWSGSDVYAFFNPTGFAGWRWEFIGSPTLAGNEMIAAGGSANSNVIYLGTGTFDSTTGRIFRMDRQTGNAVAQTIVNPTPRFGINRLCVVSDTSAFALYNDWTGNTNRGRILRLEGTQWSQVPGRLVGGGSLPDEVFYAIDADWTVSPRTLFACTDSRVYVSRDNGDTWSDDSSGLPRRAHLADLRFVLNNARQRFLFLSTFGRSVWVSPVS